MMGAAVEVGLHPDRERRCPSPARKVEPSKSTRRRYVKGDQFNARRKGIRFVRNRSAILRRSLRVCDFRRGPPEESQFDGGLRLRLRRDVSRLEHECVSWLSTFEAGF